MSENTINAAGIDTGKAKLDVALAGGKARLQIDNASSGWRKLATWVKRHNINRIGIEASGGYERGVVAYLREKGFTVILFQPLQIRAYAGFRLQRAKNDRIDSDLIAVCTAAIPTVRQAPDPRFQAFCEHLTLIEQIEEDIVRAKTRLEGFRDGRHRKILASEIKRLKAWRTAELKRLLTALGRHDDLANRLTLSRAFPASGCVPLWRSLSACPSSGASRAKRRRRWPVLLPMMTIVESIRACATSPADAKGCAEASSPPHFPPPSSGIRAWLRFTRA